MSDDWNEEELEPKKQDSSEFARMLEDSFKTSKRKKLKTGDKVRGEILVVGKEEVFVSTGGSSDGVVPRRDLLDKEGAFNHKVGDTLDLFVTGVKGSEIFLSPNPTAVNLADDLQDAFDMMLPVEGRVAEVCKGGFRVSVMGKMAFCPISQLDSARIEVPEEYLGRKYEFRITQITEGGRNIVVSRRKLLDEQRDLAEGSFLADHKAGAVVSGKVKKLEKFGAFIELAPGLEGLAHISELSWSRVADPSEVVSPGQDVKVKILKIENAEGRVRISLSIKQAGEQPWDNMPSEVRAGQVIEGKVTRLMKFGAFVELTPGVEGLVPLSEMSYTQRVNRAEDVMKEGETVLVMVKEIDPSTRRIALSLKDAGSDPWSMVPIKFPVGALVKGTVERREPYGLFIKLDDGITALLPKSKAMEQADFPFEKLKIGEETMVRIAELRLDERRIALSPPGDAGSEDWKVFEKQQQNSGSFGTLADKMKAALAKKARK